MARSGRKMTAAVTNAASTNVPAVTPTINFREVTLFSTRPDQSRGSVAFSSEVAPVRLKKTRQNKKLAPGLDSIRAEKALARLPNLANGRQRPDADAGRWRVVVGYEEVR